MHDELKSWGFPGGGENQLILKNLKTLEVITLSVDTDAIAFRLKKPTTDAQTVEPVHDRRKFVSMAQRAYELKKRVENEDANLSVIRPKDFESIGIPQSARSICKKKVHFKNDATLENVSRKKLRAELKRHKLKMGGSVAAQIQVLRDHYQLYH